ncbi:MAG: TspO/MBR family protein [Minisyncoccota bacterium]
MGTYESYQELLKPMWSPPAWIFGPVWTVLYVSIAVSYGYVLYLFVTKRIPLIVVLPFVLNLVFNFAFTPLQFGLRNLPLASFDVVLVWGTLVWAFVAVYPYAKWVVVLNIPYLAWVSFATVLQITITYLNW